MKNLNKKEEDKVNVKKVILTTLLAFFASLIIFISGVFALFLFSKPVSTKPSNIIVSDDEGNKNLLQEKFSIPRKTNFLLLGVDDQTSLLTDVIIVGSFDSKTEEFTLISIPRDTYVVLSPEIIASAKEDGVNLPRSAIKINAINSYGGEKNGISYLEQYIEEMMGITIDYYAEVDTKAFRDIVDAVGGIDMEVRAKGYNYYDPTQNLVINVPGGMQHLDGKMAEGVVRFRADYVNGDLDRIAMQQAFMKEFFAQVLNKETLKDNALSILTTCLNYTRTDFKVGDIPKYLPYLSSLTPDNISFIMLPGAPSFINNASYYVVDQTQMNLLVNEVFYGSGLNMASDELKDKKIQILNGSDVSGLGVTKEKELNLLGYNVANVGNYTDEKVSKTIIYKKPEIDVSAIEGFFNKPVVEVNEEKAGNYDIVIVLGTDER